MSCLGIINIAVKWGRLAKFKPCAIFSFFLRCTDSLKNNPERKHKSMAPTEIGQVG